MILQLSSTAFFLAAVATALWRCKNPVANPVVPWHVVAAILFCPMVLSWVSRSAGDTAEPPASAWLATHPLPQNTCLGAGDLKRPAFPNPLCARGLPALASLTGKYLLEAHAAETPIWPSDLADAPVIPSQTGTAVLFFPAQAIGSARAFIQPGSRVLICEEAKACLKTAFKVESLLGGDSGAIAVRVPRQDLDRVRAIAKPALFVAAL